MNILQPLLLLALVAVSLPAIELHTQPAPPHPFAAALEAREQNLLPEQFRGGAPIGTSVARESVCPRTRRLLSGAGLGMLVGGAFGAVYGSFDHPGLPHLFVGQDMPNFMEWVPAFALIGGATGAFAAARTARCR